MSEADDHLPISALSHLAYCARRAALVHVLGLWADNEHTVAGNLVHERVDDGATTRHAELCVLRSVPVRSDRLGLRGVLDALEVWGSAERIRFVPVETKRGRRRKWDRDELQLCAQAVALEEMTGRSVEEGVVYYATSKRRRTVTFTEELRAATEDAARRLHAMVAAGTVPVATRDARCGPCSLADVCQPSDGGVAATLRDVLAGSLT